MLSRRGFLRVSAGGILGAILSACGFKSKSEPKHVPTSTLVPATDAPLTPTATATPKPVPTTTSEPVPQPDPTITPEPSAPTRFLGVNLSVEYLVEQGRMIEETGLEDAYEPLPISLTVKPDEKPESDGIKYAELAFARGSDFPASEAPLDALIIAIAQGQRLGTIGGVTYFTEDSGEKGLAFQGLSIYRDIVQIDSQNGYVIPDASPRDLVIRDGSGISVVGKENSGQIIIAFDEPFGRNDLEEAEHFHRQMRFASIPIATFKELVGHFETYISFDDATWTLSLNPEREGVVQYQSRAIESVELNTVDNEVHDLLQKEVGSAWLDIYPKRVEEGKLVEVGLFPDPVVPAPESMLLNDGVLSEDLTYKPFMNNILAGNPFASTTVHALDKDGKLVLAANFIPGERRWEWRKPLLAELAEMSGGPGISIGMQVDSNRMYQADYSAILRNHCHFWVSDMEGFMSSPWVPPLRPSKNRFDFTSLDFVIKQAENLGKTIRVHGLMDGRREFLPDWLREGVFSTEECEEILIDHVHKVVEHCQGRVSEWVINEVWGNDWDKGFWAEKFGFSADDLSPASSTIRILEHIIQTIKQVDPCTRVIVNDFGIEFGDAENNRKLDGDLGKTNRIYGKATKLFNLITALRAKSVPVDAVGFQCHFDAAEFYIDAQNEALRYQTLKNEIKRYIDIGIDVEPTELDVHLQWLRKYIGDHEKRFSIQADIYRQVVQVLIESGVTRIVFYGTADKDSFYNDTIVNGEPMTDADATLFDDSREPKEAYDTLVELFRSRENAAE